MSERLTNNQEYPVSGLDLIHYAIEITAGTVQWQIKIGQSNFINVSGGLISESGTGILELPSCILRPVISDTATVDINIGQK